MKILLFVVIGIVVFIGYHVFQVQRKIAISQKIVANTTSFSSTDNAGGKSMLVIGDSTAVGVGASNKDESIPSLVAQKIGAQYVENLSVSGSKVEDLPSQLQTVERDQYDVILVQIGGNDVVARNDEQGVTHELESILKTLPKHDKLIVLMCGDVGVATLLPWFVRGYYTKKTLAYHQTFSDMVPRTGGVYVNLYEPKDTDPFVKEPDVYLAKDQFHPSSAGYQVWFEKIEKAL
jgi:lysophospholipase L1-like esterase